MAGMVPVSAGAWGPLMGSMPRQLPAKRRGSTSVSREVVHLLASVGGLIVDSGGLHGPLLDGLSGVVRVQNVVAIVDHVRGLNVQSGGLQPCLGQ